jgi:hypothetical protein
MIKNLLLLMTLILAFSTFTFGQKISGEQMLMDIEQKLVDGVVGGKLAEIKKYYADDFTITTPEGMVLTLSELLGFLQSGDLKLESSVNSEMKVKIYGNTALVKYVSMDKGKFKGNEISSKTQWTDVFMKVKGKWLAVSSHGTPIL